MTDFEATKAQLIQFADQFLAPYKVRVKISGKIEEIVPSLCPFCGGGDNHDEDTFALSVDKGVFVCKRGSCGKRGRFDVLAEHFGSSASVKRSIPEVQKTEESFVLPDTLTFPPTSAIYDYFDRRKISKETVDAFKIASDADGNIVFPFYFNGTNIFEKYRKPFKHDKKSKAPKEWRCAGAKSILFGMDACSFNQPLVITEGQIDAMSLYEAGITNVVSVPSGCEDLNWIQHCYDWLEHFRTIILFGDNDDPGRAMVQNVAKRLDETRCLIVDDYPLRPDGRPCKDANEVLYFHGGFQLIDMVESAKAFPVKGLLNLAAVAPYDPTTVPRIKTMIPALDATIGGLIDGGITIFTGKAGSGKSTVTGLLLLNAIEQGHSVCAYSGELSKERFQQWINLQAAGSQYIGLKYDPVKEIQVPTVSFAIQERIRKWYDGKFFLFDNNEIFEHNQADSILQVFTVAVRRHGCKLFLVDNMMTSLSDSEEETRAQGKFVNALKKFANRYGVHVIIVAHPRKTKAGEQLRKDDVGGNSAIVNLSDSAIVVEQPNLRIIKNREGGIQKLIECCYCPDSRRVYQADKGDLNMFSWDRSGLSAPSVLASSLPEYEVRLGTAMPF